MGLIVRPTPDPSWQPLLDWAERVKKRVDSNDKSGLATDRQMARVMYSHPTMRRAAAIALGWHDVPVEMAIWLLATNAAELKEMISNPPSPEAPK